ncbi:TPA: hypothetical protein QEN11_07635 [Stenotrophomonas maltophilia]|nr:hypothetical protein [Stenotrophomonas maltophilia]
MRSNLLCHVGSILVVFVVNADRQSEFPNFWMHGMHEGIQLSMETSPPKATGIAWVTPHAFFFSALITSPQYAHTPPNKPNIVGRAYFGTLCRLRLLSVRMIESISSLIFMLFPC